MGAIKAGEGKHFDEFEQFVLDHCPGVHDQEATLAALRKFAGEEIAEAVADRGKLVEGAKRVQEELNTERRISAQRAARVEELERGVEKLSAEASELRKQVAETVVPSAPATEPTTPPGGHGDPAAPPSTESGASVPPTPDDSPATT